jgi:segregation and condensation protein A
MGELDAEGMLPEIHLTLAAAPVALVQGRPLMDLPRDLYIPPEALRVFLETFEGPLDLLLYLIKRQNLDILHIPIAEITRQYMRYIELMHEEFEIGLAAEYLVMAAILAEIKSRMLLPLPPGVEEEDDPRADLARRLEEYERYKRAAQELDALPRLERDIYAVLVEFPARQIIKEALPAVTLDALHHAFGQVLRRASTLAHHPIQRETLSVRERMLMILNRVSVSQFIEFSRFFTAEEGRLGVIVAFLALLELLKEGLVEIVQTEPDGLIYTKAAV